GSRAAIDQASRQSYGCHLRTVWNDELDLQLVRSKRQVKSQRSRAEPNPTIHGRIRAWRQHGRLNESSSPTARDLECLASKKTLSRESYWIVTFSILTSVVGRSFRSVCVVAIAFTTSCPAVTLPKIV